MAVPDLEKLGHASMGLSISGIAVTVMIVILVLFFLLSRYQWVARGNGVIPLLSEGD